MMIFAKLDYYNPFFLVNISSISILRWSGFLILTWISFGRRILLLILCTLKVAASFTIPFSVSPAMFGTLRFLEGMSSLAFYQLSFVIGKNNVMKNSYGILFFDDFGYEIFIQSSSIQSFVSADIFKIIKALCCFPFNNENETFWFY